MSSFTAPLIAQAVQTLPKGWRRFLPPSFHTPKWEVIGGFFYAVGSLENTSEVIWVPADFEFDGASVTWPFRLLVPMAHPNYMQATALHDFMLGCGRYSRDYCDRVFYEALGVLGMPDPWRKIMFAAVKLRTFRRKLEQKFKEVFNGC